MSKIVIAGTGFRKESITYAAVRCAKEAEKVILRTERMDVAQFFREEGIPFTTLDAIYEECEDFTECNQKCARAVIDAANDHTVFYAVFDLRDASVPLILNHRKDIRMIPGVCEEGELFALCGDDTLLLNACDYESFRLDAHHSVLLREIDSRMLAGECKLALADVYNPELSIWVSAPEGRRQIPLCDLDRMEDDCYNHMLSAVIPAQTETVTLERYGLEQLRDIIRKLRAPGGCPWDREQTHESLRQDILEEAYEVADAIDRVDPIDMTEELGDLLLQIILHSCIGEETGEFSFGDITTEICKKMIFRHPHVFGNESAESSSEVLDLWQKLKMSEKKQKTVSESMQSVARAMPALVRARKILKRAYSIGFRAETFADAMAHVREELDEFACEKAGTDRAKEELGDILLALCAASLHYDLDPEESLERATDKYLRRFRAMESSLLNSGKDIETCEAEELEKEWQNVKRSEKH